MQYIIFPFNSGFTLIQGKKDATNAIYSLVIEPIDPLPTPRSEWIHRIQRASLKISMAMAGALHLDERDFCKWSYYSARVDLLRNWVIMCKLSNHVLCKERKLDQRKPWNHTGKQILLMIQSNIKSGKLTHRTGSTEQKLCQMDFTAVAGSLQKTSGRSNDKNKIQRRFLLFDCNLLSLVFALIIKSKFKEEKNPCTWSCAICNWSWLLSSDLKWLDGNFSMRALHSLSAPYEVWEKINSIIFKLSKEKMEKSVFHSWQWFLTHQ